jgi:hypothetical protein
MFDELNETSNKHLEVGEETDHLSIEGRVKHLSKESDANEAVLKTLAAKLDEKDILVTTEMKILLSWAEVIETTIGQHLHTRYQHCGGQSQCWPDLCRKFKIQFNSCPTQKYDQARP